MKRKNLCKEARITNHPSPKQKKKNKDNEENQWSKAALHRWGSAYWEKALEAATGNKAPIKCHKGYHGQEQSHCPLFVKYASSYLV